MAKTDRPESAALERYKKRRVTSNQLVTRHLSLVNYIKIAGGDGRIRTCDSLLDYNGLANRRLQPLGHISAEEDVSVF
jgi:hypothetical protein